MFFEDLRNLCMQILWFNFPKSLRYFTDDARSEATTVTSDPRNPSHERRANGARALIAFVLSGAPCPRFSRALTPRLTMTLAFRALTGATSVHSCYPLIGAGHRGC